MAPSKYVRNLLALISALLAFGCIANILVDPYGIFRIFDIHGINAVKPFQDNMEQLFKPIALVRYDPEIVIVGSSTSQFGMDPHTVERIGGAKTYNFGIDGPTIWEVEGFLSFALRNSRAREAIVVLDFLMFNAARGRSNSRFNPDRMNAQFSFLSLDYFSFRELLRVLFSSATLWDSLRTLFAQTRLPYYDERGFSPQTDNRNRLISEGNLAFMFEDSRRVYLNFHNNSGENYFALSEIENSLDAIDSILRSAKKHGVRLNVVLAPVHSQFLSGLRDKGLCPALSSWRQTIRERVLKHISLGGQIELHDYILDPRNSERVPVKRGIDMRFWSDAYHFSPAYGDEILSAIVVPGEETLNVSVDSKEKSSYASDVCSTLNSNVLTAPRRERQ